MSGVESQARIKKEIDKIEKAIAEKAKMDKFYEAEKAKAKAIEEAEKTKAKEEAAKEKAKAKEAEKIKSAEDEKSASLEKMFIGKGSAIATKRLMLEYRGLKESKEFKHVTITIKEDNVYIWRMAFDILKFDLTKELKSDFEKIQKTSPSVCYTDNCVIGCCARV